MGQVTDRACDVAFIVISINHKTSGSKLIECLETPVRVTIHLKQFILAGIARNGTYKRAAQLTSFTMPAVDRVPMALTRCSLDVAKTYPKSQDEGLSSTSGYTTLHDKHDNQDTGDLQLITLHIHCQQ